MDKNQNGKIRTRYADDFLVDVCGNCKSYKIEGLPNRVYHGISSSHLDAHKDGVITPKGEPKTPNYMRYLDKHYLNLDPFSVQGNVTESKDEIWFGFDIFLLKDKIPGLKFIDFNTWTELGWHGHSLEAEEENRMKSKLFVSDYFVKPLTRVLAERLDCGLAENVIVRNEKDVEKARKFAGKDLSATIFDFNDSKKLFDDYMANLDVKCECRLSSR